MRFKLTLIMIAAFSLLFIGFGGVSSYHVDAASGTPNGIITVDNASELTEKAASKAGGEITALAWSPDSQMIATTGKDGLLVYTVSDLQSSPKAITDNVSGSGDTPPLLAYSPDGTIIASAKLDAKGQGLVELWDPRRGS